MSGVLVGTFGVGAELGEVWLVGWGRGVGGGWSEVRFRYLEEVERVPSRELMEAMAMAFFGPRWLVLVEWEAETKVWRMWRDDHGGTGLVRLEGRTVPAAGGEA